MSMYFLPRIFATKAANDSGSTRLHRAEFKVSYAFVEKESSVEYIRHSSYNFVVISVDFNVNLPQDGAGMYPGSKFRCNY